MEPHGSMLQQARETISASKKTKNVNKKLTQNYEQLFGLQNDWFLQVFWCIGCRIAGFCFFFMRHSWQHFMGHFLSHFMGHFFQKVCVELARLIGRLAR